MATHEFYDRSCWMLNPDEEGHAPPPAPQLGAFLDAPRAPAKASTPPRRVRHGQAGPKG